MDLIAMVLSGRSASKREGCQVTAEAGPAQQWPSRRADKPILWWWSIVFLISSGNLVMWLAIAYRVYGLSDGYVVQQLWISGISRPPARSGRFSLESISSGNVWGWHPA